MMIRPSRLTLLAVALALTLCLAGPALGADQKDLDLKRDELRRMADEALAQLYQVEPSAKEVIQKAAGYAVFSNFGMKIFVMGGGKGEGLAVDKAGGRTTYMKMVEVQAGLGMGVKRFRLIWVFQRRQDLLEFINTGWELSGQGTASAKLGKEGGAVAGAVPITPQVWLYQLTKDGLALELTVKGTRYYQDRELN